jgi:thiol:disulfide interchange protein DsbD
MGKKNLDLLIREYETNSIPFHVIIEPGGEEHKLGVTFERDQFYNFLKEGL